jgi:cytochrome c biogenesis protein CcdA
MNDPRQSLTPAQLKVFETVERIRMAWLALRVTFTFFGVVLIALIWAAFSPVAGPSMRWAFGIIETILGWAMHPIIRHLFPKSSSR